MQFSPDSGRFEHLVRKELGGILRSPGFIHALRMRRFLEFVVQETLVGRAGQLCEYSIGLSVFDRGEAFEPALDPIVRNDARRLRQKLAEYYAQIRSDSSDRIFIAIPKGQYVPTFTGAPAKPDGRYRLTVTLVRMQDQRQLWETERELNPDELRLGVLIRAEWPNHRAR